MTKKLLKNCNILDVIGHKFLEERSILIEDAQIKKIGRTDELEGLEKELPQEAIFDVNRKLVMPGLIDCHVHLCVIQEPASNIVLDNLRATETLKVLYGAKHAKETLEGGVTTVRDMGNGDNLALRDAIEKGAILGPRVVASGWLGMTGGHQERMSSEWSYNVQIRREEIGVDGPWEVRKKVRELIRQGVDWIKTYASGEGYSKYPFYPFWLDQRNFTLEEMSALVDEAHSAGRKVAAHALLGPVGVKHAIAAGVDTLEHGLFIDEEDIIKMKEKGMFYVPTLAVMIKMWEVAEAKGMSFLKIEKGDTTKYLEAHLASFRRAWQNGVKIVMGSDTFRILKQGDNTFELECMVKSGMSEMEALVSATQTASEALGIENLVGSIEEGKFADLLVVDPSPLNNILAIRNRNNIKMIMKNGKVIRSNFS